MHAQVLHVLRAPLDAFDVEHVARDGGGARPFELVLRWAILGEASDDLVDLAWPAYRDLGISKAILRGEPRLNLVQAVLALEEAAS